MEVLASLLPPEGAGDSADSTGCFKPPRLNFVAEAEVAAFERQEDDERRRRHIKAAHIPAAYAKADIKNCCPEVKQCADMLIFGDTQGVVLRGNVGVGKTYAGCAILNEAAELFTVRFATMGDILAEIRGSYGSRESEFDIVDKYRNVRVLMIDDLGKEKPTAFALEKIFAIIDGRYRAGKPTIITTQYSAQQLAERLASEGDLDTAEAIVSRLQESHVVHLDGPDRRSRV